VAINTNRLIDVINSNKDKKVKASKIIDSLPNTVTVLPKLIKGTSPVDVKKDDINVNRSTFEQLYQSTFRTRQNNEHIVKLFPDIELSIQILVSSILSPKNMVDVVLNYKLDDSMDIAPSVSSELLNIIKKDINKQYKLEDILPDIVRESLFESGAYITTVIPESSVDEVINSDLIANFSTENIKLHVDNVLHDLTSNLNILSIQENKVEKSDGKAVDKVHAFVSDLATESNLKITDNYNLLKFSKLKEQIRKGVVKKSIRNKTAVSQESVDLINYTDIFRQKGTSISNKQVEIIKTKGESKRSSFGRPLVLKLNTESVIPVFSPNQPSDHIGYFVLLDENGFPLTTDTETKANTQNMYSNDSTQSQMSVTEKAYKNLINTGTTVDTKKLFDTYRTIIEKKLYKTINNSLYGSEVKIASKNEIYQLMFSRALLEQKTTLLFIPEELVCYTAFYYNKTGVGRSLLENLSILSSLRAIVLFAKIMAYSKMAIDVTKVNVALDPDDPDPEKTIEQIQDSVLKMRQNYFPLGINNPVDLVDWIHRAGLQFSYESVPGIPNVKIDFENANIQHTLPDVELDDNLRKLTIMSLGLSPEVVDSGFNAEFATTVVNNNILLAKRVGIYQKKLLIHLKKYIKIVATNDEELRYKIRTFIEQNIENLNLSASDQALHKTNQVQFYDTYIDRFVDNIFVELPKPENTNITNLTQEYDVYKESLDKVLDSVLSTEVITPGLSGELSSHVDEIKSTYKHYLLRKWMSDNNFYPEVFDITRNDTSDNNNLVGNLQEELTILMSNLGNIYKDMQKFKKSSDLDMNQAETETQL
jgi:hypothetical protein